MTIQDRTPEFHAILTDIRKRQHLSARSGGGGGVQSRPYTPSGTPEPTRKQRSEFARSAAAIGRGISSTVQKLERLAQLAKRKSLFDDRPVEIAELTYVIKQDLSSINSQISNLQALSKSNGLSGGRSGKAGEQESEHNSNVVVLLQKNLKDVTLNFKDVLETRTKNIQASRDRTDQFVSSVGSRGATSGAQNGYLDPARTDSPLYNTPARGRSPRPGQNGADILSLDPPSSSSSALTRGAQSDQQLLMMEEAQAPNGYIQQRGEAIEAIERTISELGGIFGQLAQMVSEQSEMIQRIDANTEDVVDNVDGAQRELLKYWGRVQGNRWLVAKMFGVLMIFFLLWVLVAG